MFVGLLATSLINGLLLGGVYSLVAVGLTLIFGVMGIANFAHGTFLMAGMYIAYWLFKLVGIDPYISLFVAMGALFLYGWYVQKYLVSKINGRSPLLHFLALNRNHDIYGEHSVISLARLQAASLELSYYQRNKRKPWI